MRGGRIEREQMKTILFAVVLPMLMIVYVIFFGYPF